MYMYTLSHSCYVLVYKLHRLQNLLDSTRFLGLTACGVPVPWWHASASMQGIWTSLRMCPALILALGNLRGENAMKIQGEYVHI